MLHLDLTDGFLFHYVVPEWLSTRLSFCQKFTRRPTHHNRHTRYKKDLIVPRRRLKAGQRSIVLRGAKCWNRLPKDVNKVADCRSFKKRLINMFLKWL